MRNDKNRREKHQRYTKLLNAAKWHELRAWKIRQCNGLCERCKAEGYITPAKIVHHITPVESVDVADMESVCYDKNNLLLLCHDCHRKVHEEMLSHRGQMAGKIPTAVLTEQQRHLKEWVESHGGTYRAPNKKGICLTPLGWMTKQEFIEKIQDERSAWIARHRPKETDEKDKC